MTSTNEASDEMKIRISGGVKRMGEDGRMDIRPGREKVIMSPSSLCKGATELINEEKETCDDGMM